MMTLKEEFIYGLYKFATTLSKTFVLFRRRIVYTKLYSTNAGNYSLDFKTGR
jgi:hypothetical protein